MGRGKGKLLKSLYIVGKGVLSPPLHRHTHTYRHTHTHTHTHTHINAYIHPQIHTNVILGEMLARYS